MLSIQNVNVIFNKNTDTEKKVLFDLSLIIEKGEFVTIVGHNGAGKSTLVGVISGEIKVDDGAILFDGTDVTGRSMLQRSRFVSRVFQDPNLNTCGSLTIEENLALAYCRGGKRRLIYFIPSARRKIICEALELLGMGIEKRLKDLMSTLSGGQRQAVGLIMATLAPSSLLILDEHTAALDPNMVKIVLDLTLKVAIERNLTIVMITHSIETALNIGTRALILKEGRIEKDLKGQKDRKEYENYWQSRTVND